MTITNGYATLAEFKDRLMRQRVYTATTIAFDSGTKTITDTAKGLLRFPAGSTDTPRLVRISGTVSNNKTVTVTVCAAGTLTVSETLATEAAGGSVTLTDVTDVMDDATIESIITAASRWIDGYCGRRFYTTGTDETRYFDADSSRLLVTPIEILSITSLATDEAGDRLYSTTWAAGDYELEPSESGVDGHGYRQIRITPNGAHAFPRGYKTVKIVGKFGWSSSTPADVREACLLESIRLFKRMDAPFGAIAGGAYGQMTPLQADPDVAALLEPYVRLV
jgi:hypothetical protein